MGKQQGIQKVIPFILVTMNILEQNICDLLSGLAVELKLNIVNTKIIKVNNHDILRIYLEKLSDNLTNNSPTLDECATFSKKASVILDVYDIMKSKYTLEVSSLGINRPLFSLQDYRKFIGQRVQLKARRPINVEETNELSRKNFTGILKAVEEDQIVIKIENNLTIKLDYSNIEKGNLDILEPLNSKRKNHAPR